MMMERGGLGDTRGPRGGGQLVTLDGATRIRSETSFRTTSPDLRELDVGTGLGMRPGVASELPARELELRVGKGRPLAG